MGVYHRKDKEKQGRVWWISYVVAGRQQRESSGSTNRKVAERLLAIRRGQVAENRWQLPPSNPPRLNDYSTQFLQAV
jgi:hypothetical protein